MALSIANPSIFKTVSVAKISGFAIGTVVLAMLFATCVELFDLFEIDKDCICEHDLTCAKTSLLRARLMARTVRYV